MKYSVLIPAHNEESFIGDCLQSIKSAADRVPDGVEIIVALNRCTDQTADIAARHHAVLVKEDSKNLAIIRNAAARAASGDVIVTIDADSPKPRLPIESGVFFYSHLYGNSIFRSCGIKPAISFCRWSRSPLRPTGSGSGAQAVCHKSSPWTGSGHCQTRPDTAAVCHSRWRHC